MSSPIGILCERLRKSRLIKYRFPQKDRRMITVSTDHITDVGKDTFFKHRFRIPVLPAGSGYNNEHAQFIAGIHKCRVLGIVCRAYNPETSITHFLHVQPMQVVGYGIPDISIVLMAVYPHQLVSERLTVDIETVGTAKLNASDTDTGNNSVAQLAVKIDRGAEPIQIRSIGMPQRRISDSELLHDVSITSGRQAETFPCTGHLLANSIQQG